MSILRLLAALTLSPVLRLLAVLTLITILALLIILPLLAALFLSLTLALALTLPLLLRRTILLVLRIVTGQLLLLIARLAVLRLSISLLAGLTRLRIILRLLRPLISCLAVSCYLHIIRSVTARSILTSALARRARHAIRLSRSAISRRAGLRSIRSARGQFMFHLAREIIELLLRILQRFGFVAEHALSSGFDALAQFIDVRARRAFHFACLRQKSALRQLRSHLEQIIRAPLIRAAQRVIQFLRQQWLRILGLLAQRAHVAQNIRQRGLLFRELLG